LDHTPCAACLKSQRGGTNDNSYVPDGQTGTGQ
jgi:hypothetical protein